MNQIEYEIPFSPLALEMLEEVQDKRELGKLRDRCFGHWGWTTQGWQ